MSAYIEHTNRKGYWARLPAVDHGGTGTQTMANGLMKSALLFVAGHVALVTLVIVLFTGE